MKKIINGKKYDTETAKKVGFWSNNLSNRDFCFVDETLYRKHTGEFFLHGAGGAMTGYADHVSGGYCEGEKIIPYTEADAKYWAEQHLDGDEYEAIFGEVPE